MQNISNRYYYYLSNDVRVLKVRKMGWYFIHEDFISWGKSQLRTPGDNFTFPRHFSARCCEYYMSRHYFICYVLFSLEVSAEGTFCIAWNYLMGTTFVCLKAKVYFGWMFWVLDMMLLCYLSSMYQYLPTFSFNWLSLINSLIQNPAYACYRSFYRLYTQVIRKENSVPCQGGLFSRWGSFLGPKPQLLFCIENTTGFHMSHITLGKTIYPDKW